MHSVSVPGGGLGPTSSIQDSTTHLQWFLGQMTVYKVITLSRVSRELKVK